MFDYGAIRGGRIFYLNFTRAEVVGGNINSVYEYGVRGGFNDLSDKPRKGWRDIYYKNTMSPSAEA